MPGTRCPRCGKRIELKQQFCPVCSFPLRGVESISDNLINHPLPFKLSDEYKKIYAASKGNKAGGKKKNYVLPGVFLSLVLLTALFIIWQNPGKKKSSGIPEKQSERAQIIENTETVDHFAAETERQTETEEPELLITETEEVEQKVTETEQAVIVPEETEQISIETEQISIETEAIDQIEPPVTEKKEETEKLTEETFLVTVVNGTGSGFYHSGERVMVTAENPEDSGLEFSGWNVNAGDVLFSDRMMKTTYFIMPKTNVSITAEFSEVKYTVTVTNGEGGGEYSAGAKVTLTADEPETNYVFDGWEIKSGDLILSERLSKTPYFFMPRGDVEISAIYTEKTYTLTVKNGSAEAAQLHAGETTLITADEADDEYVFTGWTIEGDATLEDQHKEQTVLTIGSGDAVITAVYKEQVYTLTVENGTADATQLHAGEVTDIVADEPDNGYIFTGWSIEGDAAVSDQYKEQTTLTMGSEDVTASAKYGAVPTLKKGYEIHEAFMELVGAEGYEYYDEKIKRFCRSDTAPSNGIRTIDISETGQSVQIWYESNNGTIYWYTDVRAARLNEDSTDMFGGLTALIEADLDGIDTRNVTDMSYMFNECTSLASVNLSGFDTRNVTDMYRMFHGCDSLTSLDLRSFNTSNVRVMKGMFDGCRSLTSLDLSGFVTANVIDMEAMFYGCSSLTSLDLSSFDTGNVLNMYGMFMQCSGLVSLDLSSFDTKNIESQGDMFNGCSRLTDLKVKNAGILNAYSNR